MDELKDDYKLETAPKEIEKEKIPIYMDPVTLNDEQKTRLQKEIFDEIDAIKEEREDEQLDPKLDALDRQYEGKLKEDEARQFNLNRKITKKYVDKVSTLIMQALFEPNPHYAVTPRPEFEKEGGQEVCDKQSDFLDYKIDEELPLRPQYSLIVHSTVLKGNGIKKLFHELRRDDKKREEQYKGDPQPVIDERSLRPRLDQQGQVVIRNKGLEDFLMNWPDAEEKYPGLVKKLQEGKEINIVAKYKETVYNDPFPKYVDLKNFYVRTSVEGNEGLQHTRLVSERMNFTYWDLKEFAKDKHLEDVDSILYESDDKRKEKKQLENAYKKKYDIIESIYYFKLKEDDEEEIKIVCWIAEERKKVLGAVYYPYYGVPCYYIEHHIMKKKPGFYQPGLGEDLTDSNIAQNALLNHTLEGAYIANTITPITPENSDLDQQLLEKRWAHGIPLNAKQGEYDFLQKYLRPPDINGMLALMQYLKQDDEDATRVSSGMSGKESPVDPHAPAAKTIALLKQSGVDINDYIQAFAPSFNLVGAYLLQLYYQISKEGRKFRLNSERMGKDKLFGEISRAEMIARTNIQCLATSFSFDKLNEKREDIALYQVLRQELIVARNPEAVYFLLKNIVKGWSPKWRNLVDRLLPSFEEFKKDQLMVAIQAVAMYVEQKKQLEAQTNVPAEYKKEELLGLVNEMLAEAVTPVDEKVQKEREKNAKKSI